jgi:hypothetical protein
MHTQGTPTGMSNVSKPELAGAAAGGMLDRGKGEGAKRLGMAYRCGTERSMKGKQGMGGVCKEEGGGGANRACGVGAFWAGAPIKAPKRSVEGAAAGAAGVDLAHVQTNMGLGCRCC